MDQSAECSLHWALPLMISGSREIEPFRVAKFIAHEREIAFTGQTACQETNHFVEGDAAIDDWGEGACFAHVRVHFAVHEPKGKALVTNEGLVMAFAIGNCFFLDTRGRGERWRWW